jgi:hypothetical protein
LEHPVINKTFSLVRFDSRHVQIKEVVPVDRVCLSDYYEFKFIIPLALKGKKHSKMEKTLTTLAFPIERIEED